MKQQKGSASDKEATGSKTNVIRILEQNGIEHDSYFYGNGEPASGTEVADMLGEDPDIARLQNVASLARSIFGGAVRTGTLVPGIEGLEKEEFPPQLATIAGALLLEQRNSEEQSIFDPITSIFKKFFPGK